MLFNSKLVKRNFMKKLFLWTILICQLFTSCHYYRLVEGNPKTHNVGLDNKTIASSKIFIHVGNALWELRNFRVIDNQFTGTPVVVSNEDIDFYKKSLLSRNFRVGKSEKFKLAQLHIFVNEIIYEGEEMVFSKENIEIVQMLSKNKLLTTFTFVVGSAATAFGSLVIFLLIACNCPHVYINDGENWHFTNSLFTGALNSNLERFDYKKIPDFHKSNSNIRLEIRNEEQETQYINQLSLLAIYHKEGQEVLSDQYGNFSVVNNRTFPNLIKDDLGNTILLSKTKNSMSSYDFKTSDRSGFSNLYASFEKRPKQSTHLEISVKNTKWGAYVYNEFKKLFGDYYQKWVENNASKDVKELHQNMEKAGIFMKVEINENGKWKFLENINLIGEAGFQNILVRIPEPYRDQEKIEIRLRTGYHFWEIDNLSLVETNNEALQIEEYQAHVKGLNAREIEKQLAQNDGAYVIHEQNSPAIEVHFEGLNTDAFRTLFIKSKGYYKGNHIQSGKTQWQQLLSINRYGGFSKYSKDLHHQSMAWESVLNELGFSLFAQNQNTKN
jgi:hypothetical protein